MYLILQILAGQGYNKVDIIDSSLTGIYNVFDIIDSSLKGI